MLIDWFTVSAQALNFLILVWLMKRFLYKPILNAIDAREKLIATELADADAKKNDAKKERDEFMQKNEKFDQQRANLLSQSKDEAKVEHQRLLDEAIQAADVLLEKRQEALRTEAHNLNQFINNRAKQEVFAIVRKTLSDLATVSLEERIGEAFTRRLRELDGRSKEAMGKALKVSSSATLIRSAFELPVDQRAAIQNALNETFSAEIPVKYETTPDLISGIELIANGQSLAWNIADYLSSLEKDITKLLQDKPKPEEKSKIEVKPKAEEKAKSDSKNKAKANIKSKAIKAKVDQQ